MPSITSPRGKSFDLSYEQREALKAQLSFDKGGTLIKDFNLAQLTGDYLLVVGLGGLGTKTVSRVKTAVVRECKPLYQERIRYLAFDTSAADLKLLCQTDHSKVGLDFGTEAILLGEGVHGHAAKLVEAAPRCIKEWVDPKLNVTFDGTGAGGVRQGGRFLLSFGNTISTVTSALNSVINSITSSIGQAEPGTKFTVVLTAGISGGTGAGTFVDMAYLIREYLKKNSVPNTSLSAYLYLPDVVDSKVGPAYQSILRRNTYASLKELDRYMHLEDDKLVNDGFPGNRAQYRAEYPGGFEVESERNIFDFCTFVCGRPDGQFTFGDPEEKALSTAAHAITEALKAVPKMQNGVVKDTLLSSVMSNKAANIVALAANLSNTGIFPTDANFEYQTIGFGSTRLPLEECMAYVGNKLFDKMWQQWDRYPGQQDVVTFCDNVNLQVQSVEIDVLQNRRLNLYDPHSWLTKDEAINMTLQALMTNFHAKVQTFFAAIDNSWKIVAENRCKRIDAEAQKIFADPNLGPHYLVRLLVGHMNGEDRPVVAFMQEKLLDRLAGMEKAANGEQQGAHDNHTLETAYERFRDANFLTRGSRYEELMNALAAYYTAEYNKTFAVKQYNLYVQLIDHIIHENNKVWSVYTTVVGECAELLRENADIATDAQRDVSIGGSTYSWTIVDLKNKNNPQTANLLNYLNQVVNQTDMNRFLADMIAHMTAKREEWTAIAENDAVKLSLAIRDFLRSQLQNLVAMNIDSFIAAAYADPQAGGVLTNDAKNSAAQNIYNHVRNAAAPVFHSAPNMGLVNFSKFEYISIPATSQDLHTRLGALATGVSDIYESTGADKVVWYSLYYGLPPYAVNLIKECEEEYIRMIGVEGAPGLHMSEGKAARVLDWRRLRNPFNRGCWRNFGLYDGSAFRAKQEIELRDMVKTAMDMGILSVNNGAFEMTVIPAIAAGLAQKKNVDMNGVAVPMGKLLADLSKTTLGSFDKAAYIANLCQGNQLIALDAATYAAYAQAYGAATNAAAITSAAAKLFKFYQPTTADEFANELEASLERQQYLEVAIADFREVYDAVAAHNKKVGNLNMVQTFADLCKFGLITNMKDYSIWFYNNGETANNPLLDYDTGAAVNKRYQEFAAFNAFIEEKNAPIRERLAQVFERERQARRAIVMNPAATAEDKAVLDADKVRAEDLKTAAKQILTGTGQFQLGSFGIDTDLKNIGALDMKEDIHSFYTRLYNVL